MTDQIQQARRAAFEAWAKYGCGRLSRVNTPDGDPDGYQDSHTNLCWKAFNAALDAVEIELPYAAWSCDMGEKVMSADCVYAAIESTGLGLKVKS